ncbi:MAG: AAA family ATPase [Myxococcales bacterium]|nr:AAA family ATPase [Myxococcales bacterium]
MKTLAMLGPQVGVGQSALLFDLGWVLADAGLGVVLVDLDPQAGLTALAGLEPDGPGSVFDALGPAIDGRAELGPVEPARLTSKLVLLRGHLQACVLDDRIAAAGSTTGAEAIGRLVRHLAVEHEADLVLCDLGPSLGSLNRAAIEAVDGVIVVLDPSRAPVALQSLASTLPRWQARGAAPASSIEPLGVVLIGPPGSTREPAVLAGTPMDHLGTIRRYPGLASMARMAHRPQVELSPAEGAMGAHADAVRDLRAQVESLGTAVVRAAGLLDSGEFTDPLVDTLGQELTMALGDELPTSLDGLSSRTTVDLVEGVELHEAQVRRGGLRVTGSASIAVDLEWGGGERRDGAEASSSFPLRFTVDLDREGELVAVEHVEVDVSSFYE